MISKLGKNLRLEFPLLTNNPELVFLDNAASCQKPTEVLVAMDKAYRTAYANVHRGVYAISEAATKLYEGARLIVSKYVNASSVEEIIFTRNATSALNLAARSLADTLEPGDEVLLTELEHHANLVPWQQAAKRNKLKLNFIPVDDEGELDLKNIDKLITNKTKVLAITAMSNVTGTVTPFEPLIIKAKAKGAYVIIDAAQAVQHMEIDVQAWGCDLLAFSGHKIFGPSGVGVLWGKAELLQKLEPTEFGGNMISDVSYIEATFAPSPAKFEAGTPPIVEVIGLGAALQFVEKIGLKLITEHEQTITEYALQQLNKVPGLKIIGPPKAKNRGPVFSFVLEGIHPHDIASILDGVGVAVRAGHHCAMPLHKRFGVPATTRASFTIYNSEEDVNALVAGLIKARQILSF